MSRNIRVSEPSAEMQIKIIRAKDAIASQKPRIVRCPYCRHNSIIVFEDTRGHVQTKCKACGTRDRLQCFGDEKITEIAALLFVFEWLR